MRTHLSWAACLAAAVACGPSASPSDLESASQAQALKEKRPWAARAHLLRPKGYVRPPESSPSPLEEATLLSWHQGPIVTATKTEAIFWGDWSSPGDIITGVDTFFQGFGGSNYAKILTEYSGSNGAITPASTYQGHVMDPSPVLSDPLDTTHSLTTTEVVGEACKITQDNPDPQTVYFIYTSTSVDVNAVGFCAWHDWGTCSNGKNIFVAYMPNPTNVFGCDPQDTWTTHSEGLSSLGSVTAHELSETITDPYITAWFDWWGQEIGDKCAWSFQAPVTLSNGSVWKLQGEWSNSAFESGTGYANQSGQNGCLQPHTNPPSRWP